MNVAIQGSSEWLYDRIGKLGASRFADAVRKNKGGHWAATRRRLQLELLAERLSGRKQDQFVSVEMIRGIEMEEFAANAYAFEFDVDLEPCGFIDHPSIPMSGCTPDRKVVGQSKLVEFKAPKTTTFCEVVLTGMPEEDYVAQCHWQLCVTGYDVCDLVYYDDRMPVGHQMWVYPVERDQKIVVAMETQAREFLDELEEMVSRIRAAGRIQEIAA